MKGVPVSEKESMSFCVKVMISQMFTQTHHVLPSSDDDCLFMFNKNNNNTDVVMIFTYRSYVYNFPSLITIQKLVE